MTKFISQRKAILLTDSFAVLDAAHGVFVPFVCSGAVAKLRHPRPTRMIRTRGVHDFVYNLKKT